MGGQFRTSCYSYETMTQQTIYTLSGLVLAILLIAGALFFSGGAKESAAQELAGTEVIFYKSPSCGCCAGHAAALEAAGANVIIESVDETALQSIKEEFGIPLSKQGCHTAVVDDYVVEGHVPVEALVELRESKPDTRGITLPGMPIGTPGMPGVQTEAFIVETLEGDIFWQKNPS